MGRGFGLKGKAGKREDRHTRASGRQSSLRLDGESSYDSYDGGLNIKIFINRVLSRISHLIKENIA